RDRADRPRAGDAELEAEAAAGQLRPDGESLERERPERRVQRDRGLEAGVAAQVDAARLRPAEAELEVERDPARGQDRRQERVDAVEREHEVPLPDAALDGGVGRAALRRRDADPEVGAAD